MVDSKGCKLTGLDAAAYRAAVKLPRLLPPPWPRLDTRVAEDVELYNTDDLRHLYQAEKSEPIRLRECNLKLSELIAIIRWRLWWSATGWWFLALIALCGTFFAFMAWRFPINPGK